MDEHRTETFETWAWRCQDCPAGTVEATQDDAEEAAERHREGR